MCSNDYHARLAASADLFATGTNYVGIHDDGTERLELGNCRLCDDTLSIAVPPCYVPSRERVGTREVRR